MAVKYVKRPYGCAAYLPAEDVQDGRTRRAVERALGVTLGEPELWGRQWYYRLGGYPSVGDANQHIVDAIICSDAAARVLTIEPASVKRVIEAGCPAAR